MACAVRQVTADIARRDTECAADGTKDMGMVLTDAAALFQSLGAGGVHMGLALGVFDVIGYREHDLMQRLDAVAVHS